MRAFARSSDGAATGVEVRAGCRAAGCSRSTTLGRGGGGAGTAGRAGAAGGETNRVLSSSSDEAGGGAAGRTGRAAGGADGATKRVLSRSWLRSACGGGVAAGCAGAGATGLGATGGAAAGAGKNRVFSVSSITGFGTAGAAFSAGGAAFSTDGATLGRSAIGGGALTRTAGTAIVGKSAGEVGGSGGGGGGAGAVARGGMTIAVASRSTGPTDAAMGAASSTKVT